MYEDAILAVSQHLCTFLSKDQYVEFTGYLGFSDQEWKAAWTLLPDLAARKQTNKRVEDIYEMCANTTDEKFACVPVKDLGRLPPLSRESVLLALQLKNLYNVACPMWRITEADIYRYNST